MKLLVVADLHYSLKQFDWLQHRVADFDVVVIAGDLLDLASMVETDVQATVVLRYLRGFQKSTRLLTTSGNHDLDGENALGERAALWLKKATRLGLCVDWNGMTLDGDRFSLCPWWDGERTREEVEAFLIRERSEVGEGDWYWIHHAPPAGKPVSWNGKQDFGDPRLEEWIDKFRPRAVFSGHIHQAPFRAGGGWSCLCGTTRIFNPGHQPGAEPSCIEVDLASHLATWISQAGVETVEF